eukprot:scaffold77_cov116-Isochrysis_galbana.AAC.5
MELTHFNIRDFPSPHSTFFTVVHLLLAPRRLLVMRSAHHRPLFPLLVLHPPHGRNYTPCSYQRAFKSPPSLPACAAFAALRAATFTAISRSALMRSLNTS